MSQRKRHTYKYDFLRMIGEGSVVSHCVGGANIEMLERLEKQGLAQRYRVGYSQGWGRRFGNRDGLKEYWIKRTHWKLTPKGIDLLRKLDGKRMGNMRIHHAGLGYSTQHRMNRWRCHPVVKSEREDREEHEAKRNAQYAKSRQEIVNPPADPEEFVW